MTNEYKLAPSVPTDEMVNGYLQPRGKGTLKQFVTEQYEAMLKDAPTLVDVDIDTLCLAILHDWNKGVTLKNALLSNLQKHGKLYAVKGEG